MRKNYFVFFVTLLFSQQLFAQVPTISSFSPASGPIGTSVTIAGTNFSSTAANNIVFFGAVRAVVSLASANSLIVTVPAGATFQPITVTVNGLTVFSTKPFIVTFPGGETISASSFAPKIDFDAGNGPSCIAAGDLDGDGKIDLVAVNDTSNTVSVFRNVSTNNNISFSSKIDFNTGNKPFCVVVGDLDGDGKQDIAVVNGNSNTVSLFRNTSSSTGNISFATKVDLQTGTFPYCVTIRDFNGDGKPDLAAVNSTSNNVSIFKNNSVPGSFSFSVKSDFVTGAYPFWIDAGDLDNDGKADLAIANGVLNNSVSVLRNTSTAGNISFASKIDFDGGSYAYGISIADINADDKLDLAVADGNGLSLSILLNSSTGSGNISFLTKSTFSAGSNSYSSAVGDLDGDAKPDIVVASSGSNLVSVLKNQSSGGFLSLDTRKDFITGDKPWVIGLADLDGDGKPEITTANHGSRNVSVLKSTVSDLIIHSFSPTAGISGTTVTITGLNFTGVTGVSFGSIPAASFTVNSPTSITAVVDTGSSGNVTLTRADAVNFLPGFIFIHAPVITSFSPTAAGSGDTLTITGDYFSGISAVNFGGTPAASYWVPFSTTIKAIVGEGSSGNISATTIAGTALLNGFIYDNTPFITSITPDIAPTGATVVIKGRHFTGTSSVTFGGVPAVLFSVNSPNEISAVVGPGASGNVTVTNAAASAILSGFTYIPPPSITSFTPTGAGPLDTVTITGNNFIGTTVVTFGNVLSNSFIVNSNTSISAVVAGGSSGIIKVIANGNADSVTGFKYVSPPVPVINSFSPVTGSVGTTVTISGANFSPIASGNIVYFGAVRASVISASATGIIVKVPASASYCPISVTTDKHLTVYASQSFVITFSENEDVFTSSSFASKIDYGENTAGLSIVHDLNGDGKPDLITGNGYPSLGISVYKNISTDSVFTLDTKVDYNIGNSIQRISVEDMDGDGQPDLLLTYGSGPYYISAYRNISSNGNILFDSEVFIASGANFKGAKVGDIDGDGKVDIATVNYIPYSFSIFRNVSTIGKIAIADQINFPFYRGIDLAIRDLDNDKKAEIIISDNETDSISVYRNISNPESIFFENKISFSVGHNPWSLSVGDFNSDNKNDIAVVNYGDSSLSILKNMSTLGKISFAEKINYRTMISPGNPSTSDLDGDGKPDLIIGGTMSSRYPGFISVFKNNSSSDQISFKTNVDYYTGGFASDPVAGDLNGDSRPDLAVTNGTLNTFSILINRIGEVKITNLCPPSANTTIVSNAIGATYQWQLNTGSGFNDVINNSSYSGANTSALQLISISSSSNGYQYRCVVDGNNSEVFKLKFVNSWTGFVNTAWENSSNWTCNAAPDSNTDVTINSGNLVINSNVTIRSLKVNPGATVTVNAGYTLTVLH